MQPAGCPPLSDAAATIFAHASGAGRAAIAVVRISGAATAQVLGGVLPHVPPPRRAQLLPVRDAAGEVLDRALALFMPGPGSFSGEDSAELHLHGGPAVVAAVSAALIAAGARPALPGEFTQRAFINGRMDLLEAEGIADLIAADTDLQRRQAMRQVDGAQSAVLAGWRESLCAALAAQEALIDFPDEDLPLEVEAKLVADLAAIRDEFVAALGATAAAMRVRDGIVIVIAGPPNVGKSSLINRLAGRDVAITAVTPGTTRDALEAAVEIAGVPVTLIDTAGIRETEDAVEAEGVRRARARAAQADIVLRVCVAGAAEPPIGAEQAGEFLVSNKCDLVGDDAAALGIAVSALTGAGIDRLRAELGRRVCDLTHLTAAPALTQLRHSAALTEAIMALDRAIDADMPELRGEDLRIAVFALGRISGAVDVEDVLEAIFRRFCIGK